MAEQVLTSPYLLVNTKDLSAYITSMKINRTLAEQKWTPGNPSGTTLFPRRLVGEQDFTIEIECADDRAANKVHQTLSAGFGSEYTVVAAMNGSTPAADNEVWTDQMQCLNLTVGGPVGQTMTKSLTFVHASGTPVADITP